MASIMECYVPALARSAKSHAMFGKSWCVRSDQPTGVRLVECFSSPYMRSNFDMANFLVDESPLDAAKNLRTGFSIACRIMRHPLSMWDGLPPGDYGTRAVHWDRE